MTSAYGRLVAAPTIERGVEACLRYFLVPYLGEVLAQNGHARDALPDPTDLVRVAEIRGVNEGQVALVVVATPGTEGQAELTPDGYTVTWDVRASVLADFGDRLETREAAQLYAAAAGAALGQQGVVMVGPDLKRALRDEHDQLRPIEGSSVRRIGETYRAVPRVPGLIAGEAHVLVRVEGAWAQHGGPDVPPAEPTAGPIPRDPVELGELSAVEPSLTIDRDPVEEPT